MSKRKSKSQSVTQNTMAPWAEDFARSNISYADQLTSGVMNRYAGGANAIPGGAPASYVAPFSDDTEYSFTLARNFANSGTPDHLRSLSNQVQNYRLNAQQVQDPNSATNQSIQSALGYFDTMGTRAAPQFAPYQALTGNEVSAQTMSAAEVAAVNDIRARQGADFMNSYMNPYMQQVVDASLADYDAGVDRQATQARARRDAGSAFGDRAAIADAVFAADSNRGRGSMAANLRSDAFNTAANFGMQDSNRFLEADRSNQQVAAQRAMENARLQQAAAEANARMAQDAVFKNSDIRNQFAITNDQRLRDLEMQNFNAGMATDQFNVDTQAKRVALNQGQQQHQIGLAQGLTDLAKDQGNFLIGADEATRQRIAAQAAVGQAIDERNQRVLREPLDHLEWRARVMAQTPYPTTTTTNESHTKSWFDTLAGFVK
jgi:hypothetical protein